MIEQILNIINSPERVIGLVQDAVQPQMGKWVGGDDTTSLVYETLRLATPQVYRGGIFPEQAERPGITYGIMQYEEAADVGFILSIKRRYYFFIWANTLEDVYDTYESLFAAVGNQAKLSMEDFAANPEVERNLWSGTGAIDSLQLPVENQLMPLALVYPVQETAGAPIDFRTIRQRNSSNFAVAIVGDDSSFTVLNKIRERLIGKQFNRESDGISFLNRAFLQNVGGVAIWRDLYQSQIYLEGEY